MLAIYDSNWVNLTQVPPALVSIQSAGQTYQISCIAVEDDPTLGPMYVSGAIDWNDGNHVNAFPYTASSDGTLALAASQYLAPGWHDIQVSAQNYRAPVPDEVVVNFSILVTAPSTDQNTLHYLYGPILPKDQGYPNAAQWNFDSDQDTAVLISSVKMLVTTDLGERIMLPNYGTDLQSLLFNPEISGIDALIKEKITQALTIWEPRVSITNVQTSQNPNRSVTLTMSLVSLLTNQPFQVTTIMQP